MLSMKYVCESVHVMIMFYIFEDQRANVYDNQLYHRPGRPCVYKPCVKQEAVVSELNQQVALSDCFISKFSQEAIFSRYRTFKIDKRVDAFGGSVLGLISVWQPHLAQRERLLCADF